MLCSLNVGKLSSKQEGEEFHYYGNPLRDKEEKKMVMARFRVLRGWHI
jgi:hypothetical protein